jgi:hypothetical protein
VGKGRRLKTKEKGVYFVAIKIVWVLRQNNHQRSCQNIDVNNVPESQSESKCRTRDAILKLEISKPEF